MNSARAGAAFLICAFAAFFQAACGSRPAPVETKPQTKQIQILSVFAAASMADAIGAIAKDFENGTGVLVRINAAASSTLAKQIEAGGGADVFISADRQWMDYLDKRKLLSGSASTFAGNSLVLIAPADSKIAPITLTKEFDLPGAFKGRIAVGDPAHVPAGIYAKEALEYFGWYEGIEPRLLPCTDVREALAAVTRGEVELGIVYATDAQIANAGAKKQVKIVATFYYQPMGIAYCAGVCRDDKRALQSRAEEFVQYLSEQEPQAILKRFGFVTEHDWQKE